MKANARFIVTLIFTALALGCDFGHTQSVPLSILVNTLVDDINPGDGSCSLREAIMAANSNTASGSVAGECAAGTGDSNTNDVITFDVTGRILLTAPLPLITTPIDIVGNQDPNELVIDGQSQHRVFDINVSDAENTEIKISGLTITNGSTLYGSLEDQPGAGIRFRADSSVGKLNLNNMVLTSNTAHTYGGGVGALGSGSLTISNSTLSGNFAGVGGGIYATGTATVSDSTLSGNTAIVYGGGIFTTGTATVSNSTLSGNSASYGGGIHAKNATVSNSTLSGNFSIYQGGGIQAEESGFFVVNNTIVAGNTYFAGTAPNDISGTLSGGSNNLIGGGGSGGLSNGVNGNIVGVANPMLGSLADNGGSTLTHSLLSGSPAINAGSNALIPTGVTTDQRGSARIVNSTVDIGSFEAQ